MDENLDSVSAHASGLPDQLENHPPEHSPTIEMQPPENSFSTDASVYSEQELDTLFEQAKNDDRNDELSDILLVLDEEKKEVRAVKGLDENGELDTVLPTDEHNNDFLKLDRHGDILSNFMSNFINQAKDPTRLKGVNLFKVPKSIATKIAKIFQRHQEDPSEAVAKVMDKYKIDIEAFKQILEKMEQSKQGKENNTPQQDISEQQNQVKGVSEKSPTSPAENPVNSQEQQKNTNQQSNTIPTSNQPAETQANPYRYSVEQVDWDSAKAYGITKEKLERSGTLDTLLQGYKSQDVHRVSMHLGGTVHSSDARLSLREKPDGTVYLAINGIKQQPEFKYPFLGHKFSQDDIQNLEQTKNMGRIVNLTHPHTGEIIPSIISVDHLTNDLIACPASRIKIPNEIAKLQLTNEQKQELGEGKAVYLTGLTSTKGTLYDAPVQFNADKRRVEFLFDDRGRQAITAYKAEQKQDIPNEFRGVDITEKQKEKLKEGETIHVSGIISNKSGKAYDGYLAWDAENGKPNFVIAHKYEEALEKGKIPPYTGEPIQKTETPKKEVKSTKDISNSFNNHTFSADEKEKLFKGGTLYLSGLESKQGKPFQGYVTYDFEKNKPQFMYSKEYHQKVSEGLILPAEKEKKQNQGNIQTNQQENKESPNAYLHHTLSKEQQAELSSGGTIMISGEKDKKGEPYVGYITYKPEAGFRYMFENDYLKAVAKGEIKPVENHKTQVAVNSEGKTNEATKKVEGPVKSGQTVPTEQQDKQQKEKKEKQNEQATTSDAQEKKKPKKGRKI